MLLIQRNCSKSVKATELVSSFPFIFRQFISFLGSIVDNNNRFDTLWCFVHIFLIFLEKLMVIICFAISFQDGDTVFILFSFHHKVFLSTEDVWFLKLFYTDGLFSCQRFYTISYPWFWYKLLVPHWAVFLGVYVCLKGEQKFWEIFQSTQLLASCYFSVLDPSEYFEHHSGNALF